METGYFSGYYGRFTPFPRSLSQALSEAGLAREGDDEFDVGYDDDDEADEGLEGLTVVDAKIMAWAAAEKAKAELGGVATAEGDVDGDLDDGM